MRSAHSRPRRVASSAEDRGAKYLEVDALCDACGHDDKRLLRELLRELLLQLYISISDARTNEAVLASKMRISLPRGFIKVGPIVVHSHIILHPPFCQRGFQTRSKQFG